MLHLLAAYSVLCLAGRLTGPQSTFAIVSGTVSDEQHAVLPGASIAVRSDDTGQTRAVISDHRGVFRIVGLTPGRHELRVALAGFTEQIHRPLVLAMNEELELTLIMSLAAVTDAVTVVAETALGGTSGTTVGRTFGRAEIDRLPVMARDFAALAVLTPGISPLQDSGRSTATGITAAGQNGRNNTFLVDGLSIDDNRLSNIRGSLSLDAIGEFTVLSNSFNAEFGQASGAIISVVTRSGTNTVGVRGFYLHRDGAWEATQGATRLVTPPESKSPLSQRIVGGSGGGPIRKDRIFFFASLEQTNRDTEQIVTTPLLQLFRPGADPHLPVRTRGTLVFGRGDLHRSPADHWALRYRLDRASLTNQSSDPGPQGLIAPERHFDVTRRNQDFAILNNHTFGPAALNELRVQRTRRENLSDVSRYCEGCLAENGRGILLGKSPVAPTKQVEERWQALDMLTWPLADRAGDHVVKVGVDASVIRERGLDPAGFDGIYTFTTNQLFDPADRTTYPTRYLRNEGDPFTAFTGGLYAAFLQDTWRPDARLTVDAGVRWDYEDAPGISGDRDNVAPRMAVAYSPGRSRRSTIRGSYGVYYDQVLLIISSNAMRAAATTQTLIANPGYPGDPFGFNPNRPGTARLGLPSTTRLAEDMETPRTSQATIGLRQAVGLTTIAVNGVWARGRHLLRTADLNYPDLTFPNLRPRPDPTVQRVLVREAMGNSWYRALQAGVQRRFTRNYGYALSYTLAQAERDTEDWEFLPQDQRDYAAERGPAVNDARHNLSASLDVELPHGLRLTTLLSTQSAVPYNITTGRDDNADGEASTDRPPGVSRNSARGANFWQMDCRLAKTFAVRGRRLEILVEAFNVANHRNWIGFDGKMINATFGKPTGAAGAREIQAGVRVDF